jgi:hypothetical protein
MHKLITVKFGSHLYGTDTPTSDVDIKSVYLPSARDILLQRVKGSVSTQRAKAEREKNYAGEIDEESYSLQRFLGLAAEGQSIALEVLFAPEWAMIEPPSAEWCEIVANRHRLLTRRSAGFVGYCRTQANKYGTKGSRVAAARAALDLLTRAVENRGTTAKLGDISADIDAILAGAEHMAIEKIEQISYWNVCGRKLQFTATIKHARDVIAKLVDEYGHRALQAESQNGVDWKALSHAVRVGSQAIELLTTGQITFPLRNADHIRAIKTGQMQYHAVSAEIEELLVAVERESIQSSLQTEADHVWIDGFVADCYGREVTFAGDLVSHARTFATAAHAAVKQVRKYTGEPYINHPAAVSRIVSSVDHTPEMAAAAWLHDVVEDTGVTIDQVRDEFGPVVAELVYWLTDQSRPADGNRERRKAIDREHSAAAPPEAQTIKLADLIDNTLTIEAHDPDFSRVFRHEKRRLLDVMTAGDPILMRRAREQLEASIIEKQPNDGDGNESAQHN